MTGPLRRAIAFAALALFLTSSRANAQATQSPPQPPEVDLGFGRGVTIQTADRAMSLNIRGRIQARGTFSDNVDDARVGTSEALVRRMRVLFQGNALGPQFTYYIQLAFANLDMEPDLRSPLRDAYLTWAPTRDVNVRVGQMKVPFARQRVVSSSALQMVDRSPTVAELNLDRDVGIQIFSKNWLGLGRLGYALGLFGGDGRNRLGRDAGSLYTARIETWPLGSFDDFVEGDLRRDPKLRIAIGANMAHNQNTNRPRSTIGDPYPAGDFDYTHAGFDAMVKKSGCTLMAEWMYRRANADRQDVVVGSTPTTIFSRSGWGAYAQSGCLVTARVELSGRVSHLTPLNDRFAAFPTSREYAVGVGHYAREHNLKVQTDYAYETAPGRHNHQIRSQLQMYF